MKKKILIFSLLAITGCTSLNLGQKTDNKGIMDSISKSEIKGENLVQNSISLENGGTKIVLDDIKNSWEKNISRMPAITPQSKFIELYVGETLIIKDQNIVAVTVTGNNVPNYQLAQKQDYYIFRSVFQGDFPLRVLKKDGTIQNIIVNNILKYKVSKNAAYENIRTNYNNKMYEDAVSSIDLYSIAFPNDTRENELDILLFNLYVEMMNHDGAYKKLVNLKKINNYSESEITSLFKGEKRLTQYGLSVDDFYLSYAKKYTGFSNEVIKYLKNKPILTEAEYGYLSSVSEKNNDQELKALLDEKSKAALTESKEVSEEPKKEEVLYQSQTQVQPPFSDAEVKKEVSESDEKYYEKGKKAYELSRYDEAIVYLNNVKDKSLNKEIYYLLGNSYFLVGNYNSAISNYKNYVSSVEDGISKAEALHNIAFSYEKMEDYDNSVTWYKETKDKYPGTTWARKSNIALIRLKSKETN